MAEPRLDAGFDLPFQEQIDFFRQKLNLPTERWDDIWQAQHDRAFVVAGAMKADLLDDLNQAVDKAITQGTTLETFRADFRRIVAERGWTGWTGEGSEGGFNWRTKVIYETNLRSSYAAGRAAQLADPGLQKLMPYRRYVHNDSVLNPRPLHLAWNGLTLPHDHPFWNTHMPPNGWGCRCHVTAAVAPRKGDRTEPPSGWDEPGENGNLPGIDKGWAYAPGQSNLDDLRRLVTTKAEAKSLPLAAAQVSQLVRSEIFTRWFAAPDGDFPVAVIPRGDAERIGARKTVAMFSAASHEKQLTNHSELTVADYVQVQDVVDHGASYQDSAASLVYVLDDADGMTSVVKATASGEGLFLVSLRHLPTDAAQRAKEIERIKRKAERYDQSK